MKVDEIKDIKEEANNQEKVGSKESKDAVG